MPVQDIMKDFWKKYGRSFFLRYGIYSFIFASMEVLQGTIFFFQRFNRQQAHNFCLTDF